MSIREITLLSWLIAIAALASPLSKTQLLKFDGGGIFYWYQAGACKYMQEAGFSSEAELSILGTSAGSLSATMLLVQSDFDAAAELAISQCERENLFEKPTGLAFRWGSIIEEWLEEMIDARSCWKPFPTSKKFSKERQQKRFSLFWTNSWLPDKVT